MIPGTQVDNTLVGRCTSCKAVKSARSLNLVLAASGNNNVALLCGPCFVDGFNPKVAA